MVTLSRQCRTALLFFLPGTILVAFFSLTKPFLTARPAKLPGRFAGSNLVDYTTLQNSWHSSWIEILKSQGHSDTIPKENSNFRLYERRYGKVRL
ncbi:MAG TPA: hypothetical protein VF531_09410, partial [Bacillota bacterium]